MKPNEFDQVVATYRDTMPRCWWAIYQGAMAAGFTERQAFALVTTNILANGSAAIRPDEPSTRSEEQP
jgi:hypothetical protein